MRKAATSGGVWDVQGSVRKEMVSIANTSAAVLRQLLK
jgi:hypothetical protein